jgi:hypothetical protein
MSNLKRKILRPKESTSRNKQLKRSKLASAERKKVLTNHQSPASLLRPERYSKVSYLQYLKEHSSVAFNASRVDTFAFFHFELPFCSLLNVVIRSRAQISDTRDAFHDFPVSIPDKKLMDKVEARKLALGVLSNQKKEEQGWMSKFASLIGLGSKQVDLLDCMHGFCSTVRHKNQSKNLARTALSNEPVLLVLTG